MLPHHPGSHPGLLVGRAVRSGSAITSPGGAQSPLGRMIWQRGGVA